MKKIFSLLLAFTFVVSAFCIPVSATFADQTSTAYIQYGTTARDLRAYGLHTFVAHKTDSVPNLMDGGIMEGEYLVSDVSKLGDGLTLTNGTGTTDYTAAYGDAYKDVVITSYLMYNNEYLFIAEKVETPTEFSLLTNDGITVDTLLTNVRYGLNQSAALPEAASRLSNTYAYALTENGYEVAGCISGNRTYKKLDGEVSNTITLDEDYYTTWNLFKYGKNTAINVKETAEGFTYEFEYMIPLGDVIYSATGKYDDAQVAELLKNSEFFGSYLFQVAVTRTGGDNGATQLFLTTGYAGSRTINPYAAKNDEGVSSTWGREVKNYWTTAKGESLSVVYIPSPVLHSSAKDAVAPQATGFRPGLTGYGINQFGSVYKAGEAVTFTVTPDSVDNSNPTLGDLRVIPSKFRVRSGYDTELNGTFSEDFKTGKFETKGLPMGVHTLVVTFVQQRFDGTKWVDTEVTKNLSRNFNVVGSVLGAAGQGSPQTGDNTVLFLASAGAMLLAASAFVIVLLKKKESK